MALKVRHKHSTRLVTANLLLKEGSSTQLWIRNSADSAYRGLRVSQLVVNTDITGLSTGVVISPPNLNSSPDLIFKAPNTTPALVEVASLAGGATPYFELKAGKLTGHLVCVGWGVDEADLYKTRIMTTGRSPSVEGEIKWDATNHKLLVYNGSAWETVTSAA